MLQDQAGARAFVALVLFAAACSGRGPRSPSSLRITLVSPPVFSPDAPDTPPTSPAPPTNVPPSLVEGARVSGNKNVVPDDDTKAAIHLAHKERLVGTFKLCLDGEGEIASITMLKSTGFPAYDAKILREMRAWRYRPYQVDGHGVPVCTAVTFIYTQRSEGPTARRYRRIRALVPDPDLLPAVEPSSPQPPPRGVDFVFRVSLDIGGDDLVAVRESDGSSSNLRAGGRFAAAAGLLYWPDAPWSLEATLGYKFDARTGPDGSARFSRFPLDLVASFVSRGHRFGAGPTLHLSPNLHCSGAPCGGSESDSESDTPLDVAIGLVAQYVYSFRYGRGGLDLGFRYTRISYSAARVASAEASSFGLFLGFWR